jgi:endonuclease YncB( thermonuclease family)
MFYTIRRTLIVLVWTLLVGVGVWAYQRRAALQPVEDWIEVLKNKKDVPQSFQGQLSGTAVKVIDGDTFQMKDQFGQLYTISLVGVAAPEFRKDQPKRLRQLAASSRTNLSQLILSNRVTVDVTYAIPPRNALGFVHMPETNINVAVAKSGWAQVKREYIRTLPSQDQVALIQAEREAKTGKLGVWREGALAETK